MSKVIIASLTPTPLLSWWDLTHEEKDYYYDLMGLDSCHNGQFFRETRSEGSTHCHCLGDFMRCDTFEPFYSLYVIANQRPFHCYMTDSAFSATLIQIDFGDGVESDSVLIGTYIS